VYSRKCITDVGEDRGRPGKTGEDISRRIFLTRFIKGFFSVLALAWAFGLALFAYPARAAEKRVRFFDVLDEESLPRRGVKKIEFAYERAGETSLFVAYLVNNGTGVYALSPVCTHLGCLVKYNRHSGGFLCPCHGGKYDIEGKVVSGPPYMSLPRLPMKVENERVYVGMRV
jgi:cytochrome b6-f complex iron-sulfur subunit